MVFFPFFISFEYLGIRCCLYQIFIGFFFLFCFFYHAKVVLHLKTQWVKQYSIYKSKKSPTQNPTIRVQFNSNSIYTQFCLSPLPLEIADSIESPPKTIDTVVSIIERKNGVFWKLLTLEITERKNGIFRKTTCTTRTKKI